MRIQITTAMAAFVMIVSAACTGGGGPSEPQPSNTGMVVAPTAQVTIDPADFAEGCSVALPAKVRSAISKASDTTYPWRPFDAGSATTTLAEVHTKTYNGIGLVRWGVAGFEPIDAFTGAKPTEAAGVFDGRFGLWVQRPAGGGSGQARVRWTDTRTNTVTTVAAGPADGGLVVADRLVRSGRWVAWTDRVSTTSWRIRLVDLRTGDVRSPGKGHVSEPFFWKGHVLWSQSTDADGQTSLRGIRLSDRRKADLPEPFDAIRSGAGFTSAGDWLMWQDADGKRVMAAKPGDAEPQRLLNLMAGQTVVPSFGFGGGRAILDLDTTRYAVDLEQWVLAQIPDADTVLRAGSATAVAGSPDLSAPRPRFWTALVSASDFTLPACR